MLLELESLVYIFASETMGLLFCKSAYRPFKVIQGHWFDTMKCAHATSY